LTGLTGLSYGKKIKALRFRGIDFAKAGRFLFGGSFAGYRAAVVTHRKP